MSEIASAARVSTTLGESRPRLLIFLAVPIVLLSAAAAVAYVYVQAHYGALGFDFKGTLWEPAQAIVAGQSPYSPPTKEAVSVGNPALYPPTFMLPVTVLSFLPWSVGLVLWIAALTSGVVVALKVLDVRDWRCYVAAVVAPPVWVGLALGNLVVLLVPVVAIAWRYRHRTVVCGAAVGLAVAAKLFLWPLLIWLIATRRIKAALAAALIGTGTTFVAWAVIGFDGLVDYPRLLRAAEEVYAQHSFSLATAFSMLGVGPRVGSILCVVVGALLATSVFWFAKRPRGDEAVLTIAVLAAVIGSPIAWTYTFVLLLVPLAIARPRFDTLWLAPSLFLFAMAIPRPVTDAAPCCRPPDVPKNVWVLNHSDPAALAAVGHAALAVILTLGILEALRARGHVATVSPSQSAPS